MIGAASLSLLALELIWTRIFSAEFFYTFAFLVLSLAVMGLGLGALALRLFPVLRRERALGLALSLTGLMALAAPPLIFKIGVDFQLMFGSLAMVAKVALMILLLSAAFFFGGIAIAWILKSNHRAMQRVYAADLVGAGAGVLLAIWVMNQFGTPAAVFLAALPVLLAALVACERWLKLIPVALIAAIVGLVPRAPDLLELPREERAPVIYKHWDALAKVKMFDFGTHRGLNIDNVANTPVVPFDGDWDKWYEDPTNSEWDIDVGYLIGLFDSCTFLSLGSGAGMDVLQALDKGAAEVHAVEVNGHINRMMIEGDPSGYISHDSTVVDSTGRVITLPEYTGRLYADPRVTVVTEDARTYVRRHRNKFDVVYSLSSNTWAALGSGAFALTESYLFTNEAFRDYWKALSEDGFLSMEHQMYMPRLVSEVMEALTELGVENPTEHFAVYNLPRLRRKLLLLSKRRLTDDLRYRAYGELTPEHQQHIHPLFPAPDSLQDNLINQIVLNGWRATADSADVNISPCSDDRPFVAQMGLWRGLERGERGSVSRYAEFRGFPMSKLVLVIILAIVLVLVLPLNLLPYLRKGDKLRPVPWLYFFLIGVAFMSVEVVLIQKYTLFMGASLYSIGTVLLVLLVASGVGSRLSGRVSTRFVFLGIVGWLLAEVLVLRPLTGALAFLPMGARVAVTAVLVAPLGFFMGMPFPKGALRVGPLVDWGFAVNGAASVLGGTLIVLVAIHTGFTVALLIAAALYVAAFGVASLHKGWLAVGPPAEHVSTAGADRDSRLTRPQGAAAPGAARAAS
jgi:hypothetical protein